MSNSHSCEVNLSGDDSAAAVAELMSPAKRYRLLDAWRGFACLLLVVFHSTMHVTRSVSPGQTWWSRCGHWLVSSTQFFDIGVPLFFVISGYCIMATLESRQRQGEGLREFVWRRFHRIYPPYWIALLISALVIGVSEWFLWPGLFTRSSFRMLAPWQLGLREWLGNLSLTESWRYHLAGGDVRYLIGHAWTLCYEEQFYVIAGLILYLAPRRKFLAAAFITACVPLLGVWAHRSGVSLEGTVLGDKWFYFAAGIVAYYRVHHAGRWGRLGTTALLSIGMLLPVLDSKLAWFPNAHIRITWTVSMFFAYLLGVLHPYDERWSAWWMLSPLKYCGKICFSLYLIHPLVTTGVGHAFYRAGIQSSWETLSLTIPVCLTLSLLSGAVFYRLFERRFLNPLSSVAPAPVSEAGDPHSLMRPHRSHPMPNISPLSCRTLWNSMSCREPQA